jgi:hypothetical protein
MRIELRSPSFILAALLVSGSGLQASELAFSEFVKISADAGTALPPDIDLDAAGNLYAIWVQKAPPPAAPAEGQGGGMRHDATDELYYRRAPAGSLDFAAPVRANSVPGEVWGFAVSKPELAIGGDGTVHVLYPANARQAGNGKGILVARYTRSTDGGTSFEPSRTLNSAATNDLSAVMHGSFAAAHAFGTIVASGRDVHAYWIDTRFMKAEDTAGAIFAADSRDGGRTFSADRPIQAVDACPCCQLAGAARDDALFLTSRQVYPGGTRDSAVSRSDDTGRAFGAPVRAGEARWKLEGCPLKRTVIALDGDYVYTAWFTAAAEPGGVFFSRSRDGGRSFEREVALHPAAAVSDAPSIAAARGGRVVVAWHGKTGGERRVFLRVSDDHGGSFGDVVEVPGPASAAAYPEVVLAADGRSGYLSWQQGQTAVVARIELGDVAARAAAAR